MARQETLITQKKRGPAPSGVGTLVGVRLQAGQLAALDMWIQQQDPAPTSRPEAIRQLLSRVLAE
jgi:hypothetical protein